ncbi:hypothetical protein FRC05_004892 [Tulasnella sp. 425]|nr:hypothetical protein FRC05_004892 [Tulasnella sp. 425]
MTTTSLRGSLLPSFVRSLFRQKSQANPPEPPRTNLARRGTPLECQKDSKFAQLPEDILILFLHHLDTTAKARVIQTCRYLHNLLETALYIHLGPFYPWFHYGANPLHRTLAERPDLILCIRSYIGPLIPLPKPSPITSSHALPPRKRTLRGMLRIRKVMEPAKPPPPPLTETEPFKNAVFIFTKATRIVDLDFTDTHDWASDPIFEPVKAAVFNMSLTRLYLWHSAEPTQVLRAQPELEHLEIGWNVPSLEGLDKADLPKLRSLVATLQDASHIVPGRPVEQLTLASSDLPYQQDL